jgi:hypothetical protein
MRKSIVSRRWLIIYRLLFFCLASSGTYGQKVSTILSKEKIVLGEQITLQIKVEGITPGDIQQNFSFPDTVNHIEILKDSMEQVNSSTMLHTLTLTSFDSGYWQIPSFKMLLSNQKTLSSEPVDIAVLPVDVSNMQDYHDIKDILEMKEENNWWVIASIVLTGLISLFAVLWFMNTRPITTARKTISPAGLREEYDFIIKRLTELGESDLSARERVFGLFNETSQSTRKFIDAVHVEDTAHLTTGEYMLKLKGRFPDVETENKYFQFLRLADAVKFAKYFPPDEETRSSLPLLKTIVTSVYQQTKQVS